VEVVTPARGGIAGVLARPQFTLLVIGQTVSQLGDRLHKHGAAGAGCGGGRSEHHGRRGRKDRCRHAFPDAVRAHRGRIVDRWDKRFTMVACDLMRAIMVAFIPLLYVTLGYIWPVYVVAFFVGLCGVFFNSAKMALIPDLVEKGQLLPANAALATIGRFATVAGIVGGGLIAEWAFWGRFGWEGWRAGFYMDSLSTRSRSSRWSPSRS
jgi:hypothetical protein